MAGSRRRRTSTPTCCGRARRVGAAEAWRLGLVEHLTDSDVVAAAHAYITELAAAVSPGSLRDMKRLVYRHAGTTYAEALHETDDLQWASLDRADAVEGAAALAGRRSPRSHRLGAGGAEVRWPAEPEDA